MLKNRHTQRGCLPVHCSASANHQIRMPHEIQAINRGGRNDGFPVLKPLRPVATNKFPLLLISRQKDDLYARRFACPNHKMLEQREAFRSMVVGLGGRWPHRHNHVGVTDSEFSQDTRIRNQFPNVDVFFDSGILSDMAVLKTERTVRNHILGNKSKSAALSAETENARNPQSGL